MGEEEEGAGGGVLCPWRGREENPRLFYGLRCARDVFLCLQAAHPNLRTKRPDLFAPRPPLSASS